MRYRFVATVMHELHESYCLRQFSFMHKYYFICEAVC